MIILFVIVLIIHGDGVAGLSARLPDAFPVGPTQELSQMEWPIYLIMGILIVISSRSLRLRARFELFVFFLVCDSLFSIDLAIQRIMVLTTIIASWLSTS